MKIIRYLLCVWLSSFISWVQSIHLCERYNIVGRLWKLIIRTMIKVGLCWRGMSKRFLTLSSRFCYLTLFFLLLVHHYGLVSLIKGLCYLLYMCSIYMDESIEDQVFLSRGSIMAIPLSVMEVLPQLLDFPLLHLGFIIVCDHIGLTPLDISPHSMSWLHPYL